MSKADFFLQLRTRLRGLPPEEQENILGVYEDLFRQAEAGGKSEEEIIRSLGFIPVPVEQSPRAHNHRPYPPAGGGLRPFAAACALLLFNLIFALAPFVAIASLLFSFSLVAVLFAFSLVWVIIGTGIPPTLEVLLLEVFATMTLSGIGVLLGAAMWKLNIAFWSLVKRYIALNLRLVRGD
ncbi:HAAS signaling domain-containing protein [Paenibacillus sp. YN15]|uniref:HAAS signaling domain-containing protein n=1 Tax=Paenibacillus sp. YN15 TaxID=1742774 RepID=UPI0015EC24AB|nr:DUF1700 domain-containing protein [Paenibacillus sp. YN15]